MFVDLPSCFQEYLGPGDPSALTSVWYLASVLGGRGQYVEVKRNLYCKLSIFVTTIDYRSYEIFHSEVINLLGEPV
jgi:hypothetical protein